MLRSRIDGTGLIRNRTHTLKPPEGTRLLSIWARRTTHRPSSRPIPWPLVSEPFIPIPSSAITSSPRPPLTVSDTLIVPPLPFGKARFRALMTSSLATRTKARRSLWDSVSSATLTTRSIPSFSARNKPAKPTTTWISNDRHGAAIGCAGKPPSSAYASARQLACACRPSVADRAGSLSCRCAKECATCARLLAR